MHQYQPQGRQIGHLSPLLDGPACGATGKVRMHQPGETIVCVECCQLLEEPSSGRHMARQIRVHEWREQWLRWAMGGGGPYPHFRAWYVPDEGERPEPNPQLNATLPSAIVTFRRA